MQANLPVRLLISFPARNLVRRHLTSTSKSSPPPPPDYLAQALNRSGPASQSTSATDHIGPFPLPPGGDRDANVREASKKWRELKGREKVGRAAEQTSSLVVVLAGGALAVAVIYATTSELWSENSPTKIFEDCTDRVGTNEELKSILIPPYTFHGANSSNRLRRNRRISSTLTTSPDGSELLFVRFWVEGQSPNSNQDLTWWDTVKQWVGPIIYEDSNNPGSFVPTLSKQAQPVEEAVPVVEARGWGGWLKDSLGSMVGGIVPKREGGKMATSGNGMFTRVKKPTLGEFTTGECVAELKKDPTTNTFVYQTLSVSIPDARSPKHYKIKIDTDIVEPGEKGWDRYRFWSRSKTV